MLVLTQKPSHNSSYVMFEGFCSKLPNVLFNCFDVLRAFKWVLWTITWSKWNSKGGGGVRKDGGRAERIGYITKFSTFLYFFRFSERLNKISSYIPPWTSKQYKYKQKSPSNQTMLMDIVNRVCFEGYRET